MIDRVIRGVLWGFAVAAVLAFTVLVSMRLFYALELDCIEGVMMDHVVRLARGQPIFVEPSATFIPLAYMPLQVLVASWFARLFGPEFWVLRIVSVASVAGLAFLIAWVIRRETGRGIVAAGGAGIFFMGFGLTGGSYDIGRPDPLMLVLACSGLAVLRVTTGRRGAVIAALLLAAAFFAKQHAVWFGLAAIAYLAFRDRRRLTIFAPVLIVAGVGGYVLLSAWLGPWFTFYTWEVPSRWSHVDPTRIVRYVGSDLFGRLGLLAGPVVLSLAAARRVWSGPTAVWGWMAIGGVCTGLMATLDPSAYRHVLMPTIVAFAIAGPIGIHRMVSAVAGARDAAGAGRPEPVGILGLRAETVVAAILALQFLPLAYSINRQLPHVRSADVRAALIATLKEQPGEVLMPYHGFYAWQSGKGTSMHVIALDDILRASGNRLLRDDPTFFDRMFTSLRDGARRPTIVTDVPLHETGDLWARLEPAYQARPALRDLQDELRPVTGNPFTPTLVYAPRVERP